MRADGDETGASPGRDEGSRAEPPKPTEPPNPSEPRTSSAAPARGEATTAGHLS
jgi:hypothetical protein